MLDKAVVRWNDGSYDVSRDCVMCFSPSCSIPVHTDNYKIKIVGVLDAIEEHQETSELAGMGIIENEHMGDAIDQLISKEDAGEDDVIE